MAAAWLQRLGNAVRSARRCAGLTQSELGQPLLSKSFISQLEQGKLAPSIPSLLHMAAKLNVSPSQLLALSDARLLADTCFTMAETALFVDGLEAAETWLVPLASLPDWQDPPRIARQHRWQGLRALVSGQPDAALPELERALALQQAASVRPVATGEELFTLYWIGEAYRLSHNLLAALRSWEQAAGELAPPQGTLGVPAWGSDAVPIPAPAPGISCSACFHAALLLRLAAVYEAVGDAKEAARARAATPPACVEALRTGSSVVNLLWLTAKDAYARADLAGAAICARLALLLRHASAYAL